MSRPLRLLLLTATAAFVLAASGTAQAATRLIAVVGPGYNITLTKAGKKVRTLKAGRYTIVMRDRSNIHNFHVMGRGVDKRTSVSFVGTRRFTVRLRKGTYRFLCDPHPQSMRGSFRVT